MLAAIAARAGPFPTFTVLSRSTIGSRDAGSAREVASALGLPNHQVLFDEHAIDIGPDRWRRVLWACEMHSLTAEPLFKFYLHACAKERYPDLKVMFLGQGSDEFSGGYTSLLLGRQPGTGADEWTAVGTRLHSMEAARDAATAGFVDLYVDLFGSGLLSREFAARAAGGTRTGTTWDRYVGFFRQNLDYHLWHEDRTSSAHSEQALAGSASTDGPLEADGLRSYAADVGRDPSGRQVTGLLWLVNMGLLADLRFVEDRRSRPPSACPSRKRNCAAPDAPSRSRESRARRLPMRRKSLHAPPSCPSPVMAKWWRLRPAPSWSVPDSEMRVPARPASTLSGTRRWRR
jgi:hypothetical protein